MNTIFSQSAQEWGLLASKGSNLVLPYDSFISAEVNSSGQVLSFPAEHGGFVDYNKAELPCEVRVTLAVMDDDQDRIRVALDRLNALLKGVETFSLVTPYEEIPNLTLESYHKRYTREEGIGCLMAELSCREVRTVNSGAGNAPVVIFRQTRPVPEKVFKNI